jgi:hypothetical protein
MRCCRFVVTIRRWDIYRVSDVVADTPAEAEERALELYGDDCNRCEHVDGGVDSVSAEPEEA